MNNDARYLLDDLLVSWYWSSKPYGHALGVGRQPMFNQAVSPTHWQKTEDIVGERLEEWKKEAMDFIILGMEPIPRTAIQINARNLATGKFVWTSARLPTDIQARAVLLGEARAALMAKLIEAGVV